MANGRYPGAGDRSDNFAMPAGLTAAGRRAHDIIVKFLRKRRLTYAGGRVFYTPEEWRAKGEAYGIGPSVKLIISYEGSDDLKHAFSYDGEDYKTLEAMVAALRVAGLYTEEGTSWYSYVLPAHPIATSVLREGGKDLDEDLEVLRRGGDFGKDLDQAVSRALKQTPARERTWADLPLENPILEDDDPADHAPDTYRDFEMMENPILEEDLDEDLEVLRRGGGDQ